MRNWLEKLKFETGIKSLTGDQLGISANITISSTQNFFNSSIRRIESSLWAGYYIDSPMLLDIPQRVEVTEGLSTNISCTINKLFHNENGPAYISYTKRPNIKYNRLQVWFRHGRYWPNPFHLEEFENYEINAGITKASMIKNVNYIHTDFNYPIKFICMNYREEPTGQWTGKDCDIEWKQPKTKIYPYMMSLPYISGNSMTRKINVDTSMIDNRHSVIKFTLPDGKVIALKEDQKSILAQFINVLDFQGQYFWSNRETELVVANALGLV